MFLCQPLPIVRATKFRGCMARFRSSPRSDSVANGDCPSPQIPLRYTLGGTVTGSLTSAAKNRSISSRVTASLPERQRRIASRRLYCTSANSLFKEGWLRDFMPAGYPFPSAPTKVPSSPNEKARAFYGYRVLTTVRAETYCSGSDCVNVHAIVETSSSHTLRSIFQAL